MGAGAILALALVAAVGTLVQWRFGGDVLAPIGTAGGSVGASASVRMAAPSSTPAGSASGPSASPGSSSPERARTTAAAPAVLFAATTGESCPATARAGYYTEGRDSNWYNRAKGGWTGDGCGGRVLAIPMSGEAAVDDNANVIVWWFKPDTLTAGSCAVSVYVPGTGDPMDAAGAPAHYKAYASADAGGTLVGEFDVDQTSHQGQWVSAATLRLTGGRLSIRMVNRGIDWGTGRDGAHLGVSALRIACRAG